MKSSFSLFFHTAYEDNFELCLEQISFYGVILNLIISEGYASIGKLNCRYSCANVYHLQLLSRIMGIFKV
jgi:hypothetical protein